MNKEEIIRMAREAGMNLLTDKEIDAVSLEIMGFAVLDKEQNETARMIARAIETAVLEKVGKVDVEPVAWMWEDGTLTADPDRADGTWTPLYPASALAAIRNATLEEAAVTCEQFQDATDKLKWPSGYECAAAIREMKK